ncbi:rhomboid family intramembrane serine protease [Halolamina sediminis]|jgi:membrane associated rhomboid family serine protease|uniref:rhomboid family intramembrane serine protease n=1 Tax=Halolamina sediminis TaxID=1480675 RepID=UPI0006B483D6|nr:rhomboid family intramembrane serine protease [Halolamina sediminis]
MARDPDSERPSRRVAADLQVWFGGSPVTGGAVTVLVCWHALAPWLAAALGADRFGAWFVARASPSPGWLLAVLSHADLNHLAANLLFLVIWGTIAEHALGARRYAAFLAATGVAGILAQVAQYVLTGVSGGIVGASGAAQATAAFAAVALARGRGPFETPAVRRGLISGAVAIVALQLLNDFVGASTVVPESSGVAHVTGMLLGAGYALVEMGRERA